MGTTDTYGHALVRRINRGDREAYRLFIEKYRRLVWHIVFRMAGNAGDRDDLCQDVFVKAYRNLGKFNFQAKVSTWIARIAYNTCINYLRKQKTPLYDDVFADEAGGIDSREPGNGRPDEAYELAEESGRLGERMKQLPVIQRTVLTLYHLDDLSYAEIGEVLELPEGTVKSYLFRARRSLRAVMEKKRTNEEIVS